MIATTATKLSFHGLKPGAHKIVVTLAANDHSPLGPQTLSVMGPDDRQHEVGGPAVH